MNYKKDEHPCPLNPQNVGLECTTQNCNHCGWNPKIAKLRHEETLYKIENGIPLCKKYRRRLKKGRKARNSRRATVKAQKGKVRKA